MTLPALGMSTGLPMEICIYKTKLNYSIEQRSMTASIIILQLYIIADVFIKNWEYSGWSYLEIIYVIAQLLTSLCPEIMRKKFG